MTVPIVRLSPWNPQAAGENRKIFDGHGIVCLNLIGPPGCGKTTLLEAILPRIRSELRVGVLEGDLASTSDAQRIAALGVPVVQVLTDGRCHLGADQVQHGLREMPLGELDLLIVENVGSPACQGNCDLGEHARLTALSVAGGAQLAVKYPMLLRDAALVLLTQYDLLGQVEFDIDATLKHIARVNPAAEVICTDARRRIGIDRLAGWLLGYVRAQSGRARRFHSVAELVPH